MGKAFTKCCHRHAAYRHKKLHSLDPGPFVHCSLQHLHNILLCISLQRILQHFHMSGRIFKQRADNRNGPAGKITVYNIPVGRAACIESFRHQPLNGLTYMPDPFPVRNLCTNHNNTPFMISYIILLLM